MVVAMVLLASTVPSSAQDSTTSTDTTAPPESTTSSETTTPATTAPASSDTTAESTTTTASGPGPSDADRERVEEAESSKEQEVDAANARLDELNDALADLEAEMESQAAQVDIANRRLLEAQRTVAATQEEVVELEAQVAELEVGLGNQAIEAFKGDALSEVSLVGQNEDANESLRMQALLDKATQSDIDYANLLTAVRENLLARRREAEAAVAEANLSRDEGEQHLADLEEDRLAYGQLAAGAEARLDHLLGERAALAQLGAEVDAGLDVDIDEELVARLANAPAPRAPSGNVTPTVTVADGQIRSAGGGIMVHEDIVDDIRQLLADAAADGVVLAGGGYRDPNQQIAVRRNNCGTSNYAIYEMPSSQCRPPTARPGRSMHEQGRAIDFTYNGRIISSRSGPAWNWLKANASKYGLYNLPSEPWHWSTNGR